MMRRPPKSTLFPSATLFRSQKRKELFVEGQLNLETRQQPPSHLLHYQEEILLLIIHPPYSSHQIYATADRKSTRLNSSHANISYAVFCLKKKKTPHPPA